MSESSRSIEYKLNTLTERQVTGDVVQVGNSTQTGNLTLTGNLSVTGNITVTGTVTFSGLPTSDPTVAGQLWNNVGVLTVSAG